MKTTSFIVSVGTLLSIAFFPGLSRAQGIQSPSAAGLRSGSLVSFAYSRVQVSSRSPGSLRDSVESIDAYGPFFSIGNHGLSLDLGFVASHATEIYGDIDSYSVDNYYSFFFGLGYADELLRFSINTLPEPIRLNIFARAHLTDWYKRRPWQNRFIMGGGEFGLTVDITAPMPGRSKMPSITLQSRLALATPQWVLYDSLDPYDSMYWDLPYWTHSPALAKVGLAFIFNWREDNPTPAVLGADWLIGMAEDTGGFVLTMGLGL